MAKKLIKLHPKQKAKVLKLEADIKAVKLKLKDAEKLGLDISSFKPTMEQAEKLSMGIRKLTE